MQMNFGSGTRTQISHSPRQPRYLHNMENIPTMRIVVLGNTGSGKSSLANTLFEEEETFTVNHSANSETQSCQSENKIINGTNIQLVDTPGFFDTNKQKDTELKHELLKCIIDCAPGPHVFLLTLKVEKFTSQEQAIVDQIIEFISEEALKFTTVMFTHGEQLPKGKKIEEWVKENKGLNDLVQKCGGRCHVIDNIYWNKDQEDPYRNNQHQIEQLLKTINRTVETNEGNCFTNDTLKHVEVMKESERDRIKQSSSDISEELLNEEVNTSVLTKLKENSVGMTGDVIGAVLGGVVVGTLAAWLGPGLLVLGAVAGVGAAGVGLLGGVTGGMVSEYSGPVTKAMKSNAKKLHVHVKSPSVK
uniref:AIG1-type G domain-containing protein n=1 Tax=Neogobius melanostomus TaxID=47308 RepID=A0A8C6TR63_9GOBI